MLFCFVHKKFALISFVGFSGRRLQRIKSGIIRKAYHVPVLAEECVDWLVTDVDGLYIDGTLGGGGHSSLLLKRYPEIELCSIDQDAIAIAAAQEVIGNNERWQTYETNFDSGIEQIVREKNRLASGVLLDLGVSSRQLDDAERGFSFRHLGPLDMRLGKDQTKITAQDIINDWEQNNLRLLFRENDEPMASLIAKRIVAARPITNTLELKEIVENAMPRSTPKAKKKSLARIFQAIRIAVNDELGALERILNQLPSLIKPGGRLVVLAYHSLEDRRVKRAIRSGDFRSTQPPQDSFGNPIGPWRSLLRLSPSEEEILQNPRARSARLRVAERTSYRWSSPDQLRRKNDDDYEYWKNKKRNPRKRR